MVKGYVTFVDGACEQVKVGDYFKGHNTIVYSKPEDSLRFATLEQDKVIALVESDEKVTPFDSEYYGYFNVCNVNSFRVSKLLSEKDLLDRVLQGSIFEARRMIRGYRFSDENRNTIVEEHPSIRSTFDYYYDNKLDAFSKSQKVKVLK